MHIDLKAEGRLKKYYLKDMTAASRETAFKELKLGVWEMKSCKHEKMRMKYVNLISTMLGIIRSKNFFNDFPPVTEYTIVEAI